ncbi:MAG: HAMP domain-containing sensor histidine kinase [Acidobacteriota bacterium]
MGRGLLAKLKSLPRRAGERPERASSILLPFFIIVVGMSVLAWRSYVLSGRTERGTRTIARQYAAYAADITASRFDAAVRNELSKASEDWQQVERRPPVTGDDLHAWLHAHDWITSAFYVPDANPEGAIYSSDRGEKPQGTAQTLEIYTSNGVVRYTYDPVRLMARVKPTALQPPPAVATRELSQQAQVAVVFGALRRGAVAVEHGFAYASPLEAPLSSYAIRAFVDTGHAVSSWENPRVISLSLSVVAVGFTLLGLMLAIGGLRRETETMNLRAALVANVSHELRTPLAMIRLGAETLKRGARLGEKQRLEIEDSILREVLHLSHLVENVLDVARMQNKSTKALAFTPVYPRDLVTTLISTYESWIRSKGFEVRLRIDDPIDEQSWDREAVSRALLNLIDNAIKYSGDDKVLDIALRQTEEHVVIEVTDHGIGIDPTDLSRIFEPYYRAQFSDTQTRRGAGLGLTLVQQIVASHGGTIEVESQPRSGSTFRLLFPRAPHPRHDALGALSPQTT